MDLFCESMSITCIYSLYIWGNGGGAKEASTNVKSTKWNACNQFVFIGCLAQISFALFFHIKLVRTTQCLSSFRFLFGFPLALTRFHCVVEKRVCLYYCEAGETLRCGSLRRPVLHIPIGDFTQFVFVYPFPVFLTSLTACCFEARILS